MARYFVVCFPLSFLFSRISGSFPLSNQRQWRREGGAHTTYTHRIPLLSSPLHFLFGFYDTASLTLWPRTARHSLHSQGRPQTLKQPLASAFWVLIMTLSQTYLASECMLKVKTWSTMTWMFVSPETRVTLTNLWGDWTELGQEDKALLPGLILSLAALQGCPRSSHHVPSEWHMAVEEEADASSPLPLGLMRC